jgi:hypothetical protein
MTGALDEAAKRKGKRAASSCATEREMDVASGLESRERRLDGSEFGKFLGSCTLTSFGLASRVVVEGTLKRLLTREHFFPAGGKGLGLFLVSGDLCKCIFIYPAA